MTRPVVLLDGQRTGCQQVRDVARGIASASVTEAGIERARAAAETAARQAIGDAAIDVLVQPTAGRRKRVFVADLESTVIENEMLDELADFVGLRVHVAEIDFTGRGGPRFGHRGDVAFET